LTSTLWSLALVGPVALGCGGEETGKKGSALDADSTSGGQAGSFGSGGSRAGGAGGGGGGFGSGGTGGGAAGQGGGGGSSTGQGGSGGSATGGSGGAAGTGGAGGMQRPPDGGMTARDAARSDAAPACQPGAMCMGNTMCSFCGAGRRFPCQCTNGRIQCDFGMGMVDPTCSAATDAGARTDARAADAPTLAMCAAGVMMGGACMSGMSAPCALTACMNGQRRVCFCTSQNTWTCPLTRQGCS
jgi:hypothetical protein